MVSLGARGVLRLHRGYAYAPDRVLLPGIDQVSGAELARPLQLLIEDVDRGPRDPSILQRLDERCGALAPERDRESSRSA